MLCEECGKNEASVLITLVTGDNNTTRHLCADCMAKIKTDFAKGNIQSLLSAVLSAMAAPKETESAHVCSRCGLDFKQFQKTGKLGCAQCYHDFQEQLKPLLLRIHGRSQHSGRMPFTSPEEKSRMDAISKLRSDLDAAVTREAFETAAVLRDQLKALLKEEERQ